MLAPRSAGPPPLEQTEYTPPHPDLIPGFGLGPDLNTNNILWYFYNSPFNDNSSANAAFLRYITQNLVGPERDRLLFNRAVFEEELKKRYPVGVTFVVTEEPRIPGEPWVIQRQNRRYEVDEGVRRVVMEVEATYYTVGLGIRMANSLWDILNAKMLATTNSMREIHELSQTITTWAPSTGHTYIPPSLQSAHKTSTVNRSASRAGSVLATDDITKLPETTTTTADDIRTTTFSDDFFLRSLQLTQAYSHEYMDENPLTGEPGSFVYTSTDKQIEARNKAAAAAAEKAAAEKEKLAASQVANTQPVPGTPAEVGKSTATSAAQTPKPGPGGAGAVKPKVKRNKSKGGNTPTTPKVGTPAFAGAGAGGL